MKPSLMALGLGLLAAAPAHAGPLLISSPLADPPAHHRHVNLRIIQDRLTDESPIHNSGMIAQKSISSNATLGVGLFRMAPKKLGSGDWRLDGPAPKSRRAAVSFVVKF